jgi:hypothetical protein
MRRHSICITLCLAAVATITGCAHNHNSAPAAEHQMQLPPGWTEADMQACTAAGTPGAMQHWLTEGAGTWRGKSQMWMAPGTEPMRSDVTNTIKSIMDGRYVKCTYEGDMPGMGPFTGHGITGYDNVSGKFVSSWIDNHSTGIMQGTGSLSSDNRVLTMNYTYNCPITKKPTVMREITTHNGPNSVTMEMYMTDPKSGKEYKMMHVDFTR